MPDISGFAALDVAIGLIFVYLVFSLIASGVNEAIASIFALRARHLEKGLRKLLTNPGSTPAQVSKAVDEFARHPLVRGLVNKPPSSKLPWRRPLPSYMPSRTFALAVLDTLAPPNNNSDQDVIARLKAKLAADDSADEPAIPTELKKTLRSLLDDARNDIDGFHDRLENWFDDTMDRVSGWYKRQVTIFLFFISVAIAFTFNVDSFQIGNSLLNDETLRTAVVAQAEKAAADPTVSEEDLEAANKRVKDFEALKLPIGWIPEVKNRPAAEEPDPREWRGFDDLSAGRFAGLLVTALALSFGAPFWFDLLNRFTRLRNSGPPEGGPRERRPRSRRRRRRRKKASGAAQPPAAGEASS